MRYQMNDNEQLTESDVNTMLLNALKRAMPWLAKASAEGIHLNTTMPSDLDKCIRSAEQAIDAAESARRA